jgi:tetratricopeptide (TPR) repeat protein
LKLLVTDAPRDAADVCALFTSAARALLAFAAFAAVLVASSAAHALDVQQSAPATRQTSGHQTTNQQTNQQTTGANTPATQAQTAAQSPLERRAQAYAKLLEGERNFLNAQVGGSAAVEYLRRAREAFQQAAELDPKLAEAHTALAEVALYFDDLQQSEQEGQAAERIDPDNLGAHRILSRVYTIKSGLAESKLDRAFADKAVAELREVVRVRPNDPEAWALLAEFYAATNRDAEAVAALRKWATLPASIEGRFYQLITRGRDLTPDAANARLGELLLRAGRNDEAVAAIRRALSIEPENAGYIQLLGQALEASGAADKSVIEELRRVVAQQPQNVAAVQMLARVQARAGQVEDAAATLRAGLKALRPGDERSRLSLQVQLAETFTDASHYDDAVAVYEGMLKDRNITDAPINSEQQRPFAVAILSSIIAVRKQAGQNDQALATVERMRRLLGSDDPTPDIQKGDLLRSLGRRDEALTAIREARQRFPEDTSLLRLEAQTLAELGRSDEALGLIRPRLKGDATDFEDYLFMSSLLISAGRGADAVEMARKALALVPADSTEEANNALIMLSSAQERTGDLKAAEDTLRQVLAKDPNNATALNNLGYFLADHGERLEEALSMIQRAVRAEPSNASYLDSYGWAYYKLGKLKEAERYLSDAARRNPASPTIQEHMGDLFQRLGQRDKAQVYWRKALSLAVEAADTSRIKAKLNGEPNK